MDWLLRMVSGGALALVATVHVCGAAEGWSPGPYEPDQTTIGCAEHYTDEAWVCMAVRCELDGQLKLYAEIAGGGEAFGTWTLRVDEKHWKVEGSSSWERTPFNAEIHGEVGEIIHAFRSGERIILDPRLHIPQQFRVIPLAGAAQEIERVDQFCKLPRQLQR